MCMVCVCACYLCVSLHVCLCMCSVYVCLFLYVSPSIMFCDKVSHTEPGAC